MKHIFFATLLLVCFIGGKTASADVPNLILVSDIDDTLKDTRNRHEGEFLKFVIKVVQNNAYIGMPQLLDQLSMITSDIFYVTGAPKLISFLPRMFLKKNKMPKGTLSLRESARESMTNSKYNRIISFMVQNPKSSFLFLFDNGENDVDVAELLAETPYVEINGEKIPVASRIRDFYIHKLYKPGIGHDLKKGQKAYWTTADLAAQLFSDNLISAESFDHILNLVTDGLNHSKSLIRENTLPPVTEIDHEELVDFTKLGQMFSSNPQISQNFNRFIEALRANVKISGRNFCFDLFTTGARVN